ncbi:leucine-rich repeat-containing protein 9-like isoform X3 [Oscarella lobularis]|uniref:leucine-rich repeat-containing protein 9-like isoform X3 n=1 Tax=Oscarella lobularis TaxID=121494 RepID=UPI0033137294
MASADQSKEKSDDDIMHEMCTCNGISYNKTTREIDGKARERVNSIEMFFFGYPRIVGLDAFFNLTRIVIMDQEVKRIENLSTCHALNELWICECQIRIIEGLDACINLEKLCLYSNLIETIQNIEHLKKLKILLLNDNRIEKIEGLNGLTCLLDLNLALNRISSIGDSLLNQSNLEMLNLANNPLTSLRDLTSLSFLEKLKDLRLQDAQFGQSPVCLLCNYATHLLYHLPRLTHLDTYDVTSQAVKDLAQTFVERKKLYYEIKFRHLNDEIDRKKGEVWTRVLLPRLERSRTRVRRLMCLAKEIEMLMKDERPFMQFDVSGREDSLSAKREALLERASCVVSSHIERVHEYVRKTNESFHDSRCQLEQKLVALELETGGNVQCEKGKESDPWFGVCSDLIKSKFDVPHYKPYNRTGVAIRSVYKIHNQYLQRRFDDHVSTMSKKRNDDKLMEYLFLVQSGFDDVVRIIEHGPSLCGDERAALPLTDSLHCAEMKVLKSKPIEGHVFVCKVCVGKLEKAADDDREICQLSYPDADSVFLPLLREDEKEEQLIYSFNEKLVLPEYLVEYDFLPADPDDFIETDDDDDDDEDVLRMTPCFPVQLRLVSLSEDVILERTGAVSLSLIRVLNLHGNGLTRLTFLREMPQLRKLVVSCNELNILEGIQNLSELRYLDVSFNNLTTLEGLMDLTHLQHFDVSWNRLTHIRNVLTLIRKHCPALTSFDSRHNEWKKTGREHRRHVLGRLKQLKVFDGIPVSDDELAVAVRALVTSRLSVAMLMSKGRMNGEEPRSLALESIADVWSRVSRLKLQKLSNEDDATLWSKVTVLNLSGQGLTKMSNLEKLENLRWVSFACNSITKIEGLEGCLYVEELSLEDNYVIRVEGIGHLSHLRSLNLSRNFISSLPAWILANLTSLQRLNLDRNRISSPSCLQKCLSLSQLYLAHNFVGTTRDVLSLKPLDNLVALDLNGNPVTKNVEEYRLVTIFHLKSLKALDNCVIDSTEIALAKEKFGGRLTLEYISERLGGGDVASLTQADFVQSGIRHVELERSDLLQNLTSLNLENNNLTSLEGLTSLVNLKILCVNYNHIKSVVHLSSSSSSSFNPVLENLQVLHLAYNGITNMEQLHLSRLTRLRTLFLQGNEISHVEGLEGMTTLVELVLDRNKIKNLFSHSFVSQYNLEELHMEENRLKDLSHFECLRALKRLYLGMNRIQNMAEIEKIGFLSTLLEVSLISNPATRKQLHRPLLIYRLPLVQIIDGLDVSEEERMKIEFYFADQASQGPPEVVSSSSSSNWKSSSKTGAVSSVRYAVPPSASFGFQVSGIQAAAAAAPPHQQPHPGTGGGKKSVLPSDMSRVITGVDGQLYRGIEGLPWNQGKSSIPNQRRRLPPGGGGGSEWHPQASTASQFYQRKLHRGQKF